MQAAFERAHKARFGFIDRDKKLVIEAASVEAVGGGATFREATRKTMRTQASGARAADTLFLQRQMAQGGRVSAGRAFTRAQSEGTGDHH